jgi:hypothetical protein
VWRIRPGQRQEPKQHHWLFAFEFACIPEQAECLRLLMQTWIGRASAEGTGEIDH